MRVPPIQTRRRSFGLRGWLVVLAIAIIVLILSLRGLARLYTDYLWFKEVHFSHTWRSLIGAKLAPAVIFSVIFFVVLLVDLIVADRIAPVARTTGPEDEIIERYRGVVEPYAGRIRVGVALFFAIVMGSGVSSRWRDWILFSNATSFGVKDPQFHKDIGFYVFRLPFLEFIASWTFAALIVVLIITAVFHYLNGGIRLQSPFQRVTPQVKVHISVILALMALTKTVQYYLARFELTFSHRGVVDGATYTDVHWQLPALNLLILISVVAAILFIGNIFRRGWVYPIIAVGLWGFVSIVVGTIIPAFVQRFEVQPNEFAREQTYIKRNIEATRAAFGLDKVAVEAFPYATDLTTKDVKANVDTLDNARLWDPPEMGQVLSGTEGFKPYYQFDDLPGVDRYSDPKTGAVQQTLSGVRELNAGSLPSNTWTNRHLVYTHGVGVDIAAANQQEGQGPSYLLSDIPPTPNPASPVQVSLTQPDVYFGQGLSSYAVVDTKVAEQEATGEQETQTTKYQGSGGVPISGFARRAAFALRFGDWNLFVSGQLTGQSRVLYLRNIQDRVRTAAPFLQWDNNPYAIVLGGRVVWVLDGYTTTNRYPYSQSVDPNSGGLDTTINYVRNSVKATVDAYDGTIHFYVVDPSDPIIRTYRKAFPDLFQDVRDMPSGLRAHWRYPVDIFNTQTEQYALYHMTDPQQFFQKAALWDVAPNPDAETGTATLGAPQQVSGSNGGRNSTLASGSNPINSLYLQMQLPGQHGQEFVLERPFIPISKTNQLSSFLVARQDGDNYGKLVLYQAPDQSVAPSPARAAVLIESDPNISKTFSLLDQRGSKVLRGEAQLVPVGNSIFYVRPIWVEGSGAQPYPTFRFVAVTYGNTAVLDSTVADAVTNLVNGTTPQVEINGSTAGSGPPPSSTTTTTTPPTAPVGNRTVAQLLAQASQEFDLANQALASQDLAAFDRHYKLAQQLVAQAQALESRAPAATTTVPPPSTTTAPAKTTTTVAHA